MRELAPLKSNVFLCDGKALSKRNRSSERNTVIFASLLSEFDLIHTCYHEAVEAFMVQLKQSASSEMTAAVRTAFTRVEELMVDQTEMLKNSGLTSTLNKNSDDL